MTAPRVLTRDAGFDRSAAKRDGYTDAEIDAHLAQRSADTDPYKPTTPTAKRDATAVVNGRPTGEVYANDPIQLARALAQGATFGGGDEVEAAFRAPFSERTYGEIVQDVRGQNREYARQHPVVNALAQTGGSLLTGGGVARALTKAPMSAETMSAGARMLHGAKTGAKIGGVTGGATGFNSGETMGQRVTGAVTGGALGATVGGVVGGAVEGGSRFREMGEWMREMRGRTTGEAARQRAMGKVAKDLERAGLAPEQIREQLATIPDDVPYTILDVGGQNVRGRGAAVAAVPSRGKEVLTTALRSRRDGDGGRVVEAFKKATGAAPDEVNLTAQAMEGARGAAANREYTAAREAGAALLPQEYRDLMNSPTIRKAYGEITDELAEAGKTLVPIYEAAEIIGKDGSRTLGQVVMDQPNVETLDHVYRHLRDKASNAFNGGRSSQGQQYKALSEQVRGLLDDPALGVPEYTQARQNFANASRRIDARRDGKDFRSLQPEEITATVGGMADDVAPQYRAGATRQVFEEVQQRGPRTAVSKVDNNAQMRGQNLAVAGPGPRADALAARLDAEHTMGDTYNAVLSGSRTTPLKEGVEDLGASQWDAASDALDLLATQPSKAGIVKRIKDAMQHRAMVGRGEVADQLGEMLTQGATSRDDLQRFLNALQTFKTTQALKQPVPMIGPTRASAAVGYSTGRR